MFFWGGLWKVALLFCVAVRLHMAWRFCMVGLMCFVAMRGCGIYIVCLWGVCGEFVVRADKCLQYIIMIKVCLTWGGVINFIEHVCEERCTACADLRGVCVWALSGGTFIKSCENFA